MGEETRERETERESTECSYYIFIVISYLQLVMQFLLGPKYLS